MSSKIILDTNAYSALSRGDADVLDVLSKARRTYIPMVVIGELFAGFKKGALEGRNRKQFSQFLSLPSVKVLQSTFEVAEYYAEISSAIYSKGKPIPTNDVWIAAHAMEQGAVLVTYDKHFKQVDGLRLWK